MDAFSTGRVAETLGDHHQDAGPTGRAAPLAPKPRPEGRLNSMLRRLLMRRATVTACEPVAEGFRLITLESPDLRNLEWTPGDKIQIALGSVFVARTYTPIEWDPEAGRTRILAYAHGAGPGSDWIRDLKAGDVCDVFGPRPSLDVSWVPGPVFLLGDETAFGLAAAMRRQGYADKVEFMFEVNDMVESRRVLDALDFRARRMVERQADDSHLVEIETRLPALAASGATFVLTGRSVAIQRMRRVLKRLELPAERLMTKAYWAPGKAGLD